MRRRRRGARSTCSSATSAWCRRRPRLERGHGAARVPRPGRAARDPLDAQRRRHDRGRRGRVRRPRPRRAADRPRAPRARARRPHRVAVPGLPALDERERFVVAEPATTRTRTRVSRSPFPRSRAPSWWSFTVAGEEKRDAFDRIRAGDDLPAARVRADRVLWLVDPAAAGQRREPVPGSPQCSARMPGRPISRRLLDAPLDELMARGGRRARRRATATGSRSRPRSSSR